MKDWIRGVGEVNGMWDPQGYPSPEAGEEFWNNVVIFKKNDLEAFAEAIVYKCALVAMREDHEPHECILNHFGIDKNQ